MDTNYSDTEFNNKITNKIPMKFFKFCNIRVNEYITFSVPMEDSKEEDNRITILLFVVFSDREGKVSRFLSTREKKKFPRNENRRERNEGRFNEGLEARDGIIFFPREFRRDGNGS